MATTGKNEPCPCGSGRSYGDCCFIGDVLGSGRADAKSFSQAIEAVMEGRQFSSLEEANAELDRLTRARNAAPLDEFCGLSPEQMERFLYHPFDSPGLIDFNLALKSFPDSPFFRLFTFLERNGRGRAQGDQPGQPAGKVRERRGPLVLWRARLSGEASVHLFSHGDGLCRASYGPFDCRHVGFHTKTERPLSLDQERLGGGRERDGRPGVF
jgi:hypothetical protein